MQLLNEVGTTLTDCIFKNIQTIPHLAFILYGTFHGYLSEEVDLKVQCRVLDTPIGQFDVK